MQKDSFASENLLSELPDHLVTGLFSGATPMRLKAGRAVFRAGDVGDGCYRVEEGLLKVTMSSRSGNEQILAFLGPHAIVGELSMLDSLPRSASVVAVRDSTLRFVRAAAFWRFAEKNSDVYKTLVVLLTRRLRETNGVVAAMSFMRIRGRIARALLELARDYGHDAGSGRIIIRQKIGQSDLAGMVGSARENVTRVLNEWQRKKLVTRV
jgi:CRP/FNR family transcriptional regulator, cyclic AMP receptor protein